MQFDSMQSIKILTTKKHTWEPKNPAPNKGFISKTDIHWQKKSRLVGVISQHMGDYSKNMINVANYLKKNIETIE
jgi:hypothetical protein